MSFLTTLPEKLYVRDAFQGFAPTDAFSMANARTMMWLSQLSYEESPNKLDNIRALWDLASVERVPGAISTTIAIQDTAALVVTHSAAVVVAFAGTDPLKLANWVTNFTLDP